MQRIKGFSKLSKDEKIDWLINFHQLQDINEAKQILQTYWNKDSRIQDLHDNFSENTLSNFYMPFGVAPNFLINGELTTIPMVTEESSVVAAASKAAGFWLDRGGFLTEIIGTEKLGHVHFFSQEPKEVLNTFFLEISSKILEDAAQINSNMKARGGGIKEIRLVSKTSLLENYYQLEVSFETLNAMGANFINSCLESFAQTIRREADVYSKFKTPFPININMCILSNYVPNCLARSMVSCEVKHLATPEMSGEEFAEKFVAAVRISQVEPYRAVTHNKGIMNGVDAVVIATGNDFRAIESCVHAYACRDGGYRSLSDAQIVEGVFTFFLQLPLALGTVGGVTSLHPLAKLSLDILGRPSASKLMEIVAVAGLAQNFAAIQSLITTGIQKGHMRMHLTNILAGLNLSITKEEREILVAYFDNNTVSNRAVLEKLERMRGDT